MPTIEGVYFQAFCAFCHWPMCGEVVVEAPTATVPLPTIKILPCPRCQSEAGGQGYASGHRHGEQAGSLRDATRRMLNEQAIQSPALPTNRKARRK